MDNSPKKFFPMGPSKSPKLGKFPISRNTVWQSTRLMLANQKLSCWYHGTAFTCSHTKPPIMPCFSECPSVLFIIQSIFPLILFSPTHCSV